MVAGSPRNFETLHPRNRDYCVPGVSVDVGGGVRCAVSVAGGGVVGIVFVAGGGLVVVCVDGGTVTVRGGACGRGRGAAGAGVGSVLAIVPGVIVSVVTVVPGTVNAVVVSTLVFVIGAVDSGGGSSPGALMPVAVALDEPSCTTSYCC